MICSICLEEFQEKDAAKSEPCEHFFHESCLRTSLSYSTRCPMCRDKILVVRRVISDGLIDVRQNDIGGSSNSNMDTYMGLETTPGEIQQIRETVEVLYRGFNIICRPLERTYQQFQRIWGNVEDLYSDTPVDAPQTGIADSNDNNRNIGLELEEMHPLMQRYAQMILRHAILQSQMR